MMENNAIDVKRLRTKVAEIASIVGFEVVEKDVDAKLVGIVANPVVNLFRTGLEFIGLDEDDDRELLEKEFGAAGIQCNPSVTAWCAAFVDLVIFKAGFPIADSLAAKVFNDVGEIGDGSVGNIAVWRNHVAIVAGYAEEGTGKVISIADWESVKTDSGGELMVLGGNQSDMVNISPKRWYDQYSKFLGYRRVA